MKIKLDENIPSSLTDFLVGLGHDTDSVVIEGIQGQPDTPVWDAAQRAGRFFITQDLDFSDVRRYLPGTHHGLLVIRLKEASRRALVELVRALFVTEDVETWPGCFIVATERKVRVQRVPKDLHR